VLTLRICQQPYDQFVRYSCKRGTFLPILGRQRRNGVPTQHPVPTLRTPVLAKTPLPLQVQQLVHQFDAGSVQVGHVFLGYCGRPARMAVASGVVDVQHGIVPAADEAAEANRPALLGAGGFTTTGRCGNVSNSTKSASTLAASGQLL
jgi:hypothetical protein